MTLPTIPECYKLMEERSKLPLNIILHSEKVAKVAIFLARKLKENGEEVDIDLVRTSALLHDIGKPVAFKGATTNPEFVKESPKEDQTKKWLELKERFEGKDHEEVGALLLKEYPAIGKIIRAHRFTFIIEDEFESWEEKLIYYADKTVMHDRIVGLKERLEDGHRRYIGEPPWPKETIEIDNKIYTLEKEIFDRIELTPDVLFDLNNVCFHNMIDDD